MTQFPLLVTIREANFFLAFKMSLFLPKLECKKDIDEVIKSVVEKVVVLRFGRDEDSVCLQLDEILSKTAHDLSNMASIYIIDVDKSHIYTRYFDISYIPCIVFFFNGQHMKVDYGSPDHTKFVGSFKNKQDFMDLIEVIYRGAMRGKMIVQSPIDPRNMTKYDLLYHGI
ncbi:thioredoxin-like protein 4B [Pseudoliparis swirei]|uniref:thioredoxin-like protein 4B n=1 Tax=Pseudoliparis swirei TaxID=2059687 RepID=UPI0024BD6F56|nr:thioredoxin-like protein 4B [Pseudoliparis swirei]